MKHKPLNGEARAVRKANDAQGGRVTASRIIPVQPAKAGAVRKGVSQMFTTLATISDLQTFAMQVQNELTRRGYTRASVTVRISADTDYRPFSISGWCYWEEEYDSISTGAETVQELPGAVMALLNEKFPPAEERRKHDFNKAMANLALLADKIGETAPAYADFAKSLREHMQSNRLEQRQ